MDCVLVGSIGWTQTGPIVAALFGGMSGALIAAFMGRRHDFERWLREAQVSANSEVLSALQELIHRLIDLARTDDVQKNEFTAAETPQVRLYRDATVGWNAALHRAYLVNPREVAELLHPIDVEIDRLSTAAVARTWSREDFRLERRALGKTVARFLTEARDLAGVGELPLDTIWTWDMGPGLEDQAP